MNQMQYRQPIKWGLIILFFILFFPVGFYFLTQEYRQKRSLYEYGKMLKTTGIVCGCIGVFYLIFFPVILTTTSDGAILTTSQKFGYGFMMLAVFGSIGVAFFLSGIKKLKQAAYLQTAAKQEEILNNHPFVDITCPGCGAHIRSRKGIATRCEYCGNEIIV